MLRGERRVGHGENFESQRGVGDGQVRPLGQDRHAHLQYNGVQEMHHRRENLQHG